MTKLLAPLLLLAGCTSAAAPPVSRFAAQAPSSWSSASLVATARARACFEAATARQPGADALAACTSVLEGERLAPAQQAASLINRGIIHMQMKNLDAAIADFDAAIALRPETAEAWVNKGIAHIRKGDDATAAALLSKGLELGPENPAVAHYSRAYAYEGIGKLREAYEDYGRAAALAPDWPDPYEQLKRFRVVRVKTAGA